MTDSPAFARDGASLCLYLTADAVQQWQVVANLPTFSDAAESLESLCRGVTADRLVSREGHIALYRVRAKARGLSTRIELTVSFAPRPEGPWPQLLRVRNKGK